MTLLNSLSITLSSGIVGILPEEILPVKVMQSKIIITLLLAFRNERDPLNFNSAINPHLFRNHSPVSKKRLCDEALEPLTIKPLNRSSIE